MLDEEGKVPYDNELRRRQIIAWHRPLFVDTLHIEGSILDAGCNDGFWCSVFWEWGMKDTLGIDPNRQAIQLGLQRWPYLRLSVMSIEQAHRQHLGGFDVVFASMVTPYYTNLEHASELTRMMLTMAPRLILGLSTDETNKQNAKGQWNWSVATHIKAIAEVGGHVTQVVYRCAYPKDDYVCLEVIPLPTKS